MKLLTATFIIYFHSPLGTNVICDLEDFRYSTLEHLLIDVIIASHAHHFKGTIDGYINQLIDWL